MRCQHGGACSSSVGVFTCICQPGYTGALCQHNIDDCDADPCQNDGKCLDAVNTYTCQCPPGYYGEYSFDYCIYTVDIPYD